jgi:uncharacterized protein with FMN-binding domain
MVDWIAYHSVFVVFVIVILVMGPILFFSARAENKERERERIKQVAETEYKKWKKEHGMGDG